MSAGVSDQRMKGQGNQVSNGPKEQLGVGEGAGGSEDFESWRSQQQPQQGTASHTPYGATAPISSATDLYGMSTGYYGSGGTFPYQAYGVGDGTWSNGTDMTFLGGYATHDSYSMDGMFGPSTTFSTTAFGQPSTFNYFQGNGDYSTWGTHLNQQRKAHYDDYYRADTQNMYATPQAMQDNSLALKSVEQGMQNLDLKASSSEQSKDSLNSVQPKKLTWASIASQPAKPQVPVQNSGLKKKGPGMPPGPMIPGKHNMDIGTWDTNKNTPPQLPVVNSAPPKSLAPNPNMRPSWTAPMRAQSQPQTGQLPTRPTMPQPTAQHIATQNYMTTAGGQQPNASANAMLVSQHQLAAVNMPQPAGGMSIGMPHVPGMVPPSAATAPGQQLMAGPTMMPPAPSHPVLDELRVKNNYNPPDFDLSAPNARFFVIKSYSEDDIHRSIKYEIWCSTEHGNKRLDQAFREREKEPNGCVYLFFSVNGSGHFCGMAQMVSPVDYNCNSSVWSQDKWKGQFRVRWVYVKDVPNIQLRQIRLENNENKPVTNSRDTQEVPHSKGLLVLRIIHTYRHSTSIFDDFIHYEKRQEEEDSRKIPTVEPHHHHQAQQPSQLPQQQQRPGNDMRENHHGGGGGHRGGSHRNHDRGDRDRGDRDRDGDVGGHRQGGGHRNNDAGHHHGGGGPHHKDRGDNSRGRGRGGRNMN